MEGFGFKDRWAYRDEASGQSFGLSEVRIREVCSTADVFVNLSCSTFLREEYAAIPARVLVDSDPMFTQIQYMTQEIFTPGSSSLKQLVDSHNYHFSFGENINGADCMVPRCGIEWKPTRQPVCLPYWKETSHSSLPPSFTTLMNWTAAKLLRYREEDWGQKDIEFLKIIDIPALLPEALFSVVVNKTGNLESTFPGPAVEKAGWQVLDPDQCAGNWNDYQQFIAGSYGEFSVAKHTYVKARTGWFSCRSACYLAAAKPVITQDTGWSGFIPAGRGLFAFNDLPSAVEAIQSVVKDYPKHSRLARETAAGYFDSQKVLSHLLSRL
jgi:hypothetical protein